jgi:signal transduction histidine kinase/CheY-like chemotaxis protein
MPKKVRHSAASDPAAGSQPGGDWRRLALLQEVNQALAYALLPEEVFRRLLDAIERAFDPDLAACLWSAGAAPSGLVRLMAPVPAPEIEGALRESACALGVPWERRPPLQVERSLRYRQQDSPVGHFPPFRLAAPLHHAGAPAGLLLMASSVPALAEEANRRLLLGIANQTSLTLERLETSRAAESGKFQAVIDSLPAGVLILDAAARVRLANPAARALLEELSEPAGGTLRRLGGVDLSPLLSEALRGGALRGREVENAGRVLRLSLGSVRGAAFEEPAAVLVVEEVTEQRRVQERLLQGEKLSALGEMISGVAHELNNPLATVIGYAQLLLEGDLTREMRRVLAVVDSEAARCQRIVHSLLAFARRHPPERRPVDVAALVREAAELVAYGVRSEGIEVQTDLEPGLPAVLGDAHRLQQVFVNILQNARQAMENSPPPRCIRVSGRRAPEGVKLEFSDTGPGIRPEHLTRVFEPFFTTKEVGRGTGLGLSLAYAAVRDHGGGIEARNLPGGGACFAVTLPAAVQPDAAEEVSAAPTAAQEAPAASAPAGERILVVDDEERLATVVVEALRSEGYQADAACSGAQALGLLQRERYDLVITDLKMPGMSGPQLREEILRLAPGLAGRILFSTGDVANASTRRFLEETGSACLTKPFRLADLRRAVRGALEKGGANP